MSVCIGQERCGGVLHAPVVVVTSRQQIFTLVLTDLHLSEAACAVDEPCIATVMGTIRQSGSGEVLSAANKTSQGAEP